MYLYDVRTNRSVLRTAWRSRARLSCARPPSSTAVRSISICRNIRLYTSAYVQIYVCILVDSLCMPMSIYLCVYRARGRVSALLGSRPGLFRRNRALCDQDPEAVWARVHVHECVCVRACRSVFGACVCYVCAWMYVYPICVLIRHVYIYVHICRYVDIYTLSI